MRSNCRGTRLPSLQARMKRRLACLLSWPLLAATALAQRDPRLGYAYPAGGSQGTTFEAVLGGQSFDGATNVFFSGTGIRAGVLRHDRQVTPQEQKVLAETLSRLRAKRAQDKGLSEAEEKRAAEIRKKLDGFGRRLANPGLNEFVTLRVTIAPDAAPGRREIRLRAAVGLSNPLAFHVGQLPEFSKMDWKNIPKSRDNMDPERSPVPDEMSVTIPIVLNGQVPPGGVDRFRFTARQGQSLRIKVSARELIPYIADAVPGWLQPVVRLTGAGGREIEGRDDQGVHLDPELFYDIHSAGEYVLEFRDALYRGREDFVYRITVDDRLAPEATFPLRAAAAECLPEILAASSGTQSVALPVVINGCITRPRDTAIFRFEGRAGQPVVAEVHARRIDSPLDSALTLTDAGGRRLAFNDDHTDEGAGLNTHHADSYLFATLPAAGAYFIRLGDTLGGGSPAHAYRLRLSAPCPDFELRVTPSSLNVRAGAVAPLTVYALRKDGFNGPIKLGLNGAPDGFSLAAAEVPAGADRVRITLADTRPAADEPFALQIHGTATIDGRKIVHAAVPADDMVQAFSYRHLVPAQELMVAVWGRSEPQRPATILTATPLRLRAGESARVAVAMPIQQMMGKIEFALNDAPDGIVIKEAVTGENRADLLLETDATRLKPGTKGNLVIQAFAERGPQSNRQEPSARPRRVPLGALPAIPFEVVGE